MSSFSRNKFRSIEIVAGPALGPTIGWTAAAVFVQSVLAQFITFRGAMPSFVTIAVVLYALKVGARRGALLGIIAGVLEDSFGGSNGAWTVAMTLTALAAGGVSRAIFSEGFVMPGALVALATILRDAIFWSVMSLEGYPGGLAVAHAHATLWQAAFTGTCAVAYLVLRERFVVDRTAVERFP